MTETKQPQDRKPKKAKHFTFTVGEVTHSLPPASDGVENISGRALRDASMGGDEEQLRLGFSMLEACGAEQAAIDALYDLPASKMLENIRAWMTFGDGDGASVPQS